MKTLLLFDAETQHYRQSIYRYFHREFQKIGYKLKVYYDKNLNQIDGEIFEGIQFTFGNFNRVTRENKCQVIILFVWLRYKFLLPFMMWNRLKGTRMITWSHGINLQKRDNTLMNQFYYLRQKLAHALIIFSKNEKKYIRASHRKLFVANNTLNFHDLPKVKKSKEVLKKEFGLGEKKIILCVGRMDTNNRKLDYLLNAFDNNSIKNSVLVVVGPGVSKQQKKRLEEQNNTVYLGTIFDPIRINEIYKMSDVFCMPGAIGLAINQAFYHGLPVVLEDVPQGPEAVYLKDGKNGYYFKKGDIPDMSEKINYLLLDKKLYGDLSNSARQAIRTEGSIEKMLEGFIDAIKYVTS